MNEEIQQYVFVNIPDAVIRYDGFHPEGIVEFNLFDLDFKIELSKDLSLDEFLEAANERYKNHLKNRAEFHISMGGGYKSQLENFKPIFK